MLRVVRFAAAALPALLFAVGTAQAQSYQGARLLAFEEAQRALTSGNDSIYLNPAGMALAQVYSVELGYLDDLRGSDRRFNASILDSQAGPVAGAVAYTYSKRRPDAVSTGEQRLEGHRAEASLATRVADSAALGVTARYLTYDHKEGDAELDGGFNAFTLDAGIQWRITQGFSVGLVGYNLTNSDRPELPIGWGAGLGYQAGPLSVEGDVRYNAKIGGAQYAAALGYVVAERVPLRLGGSYDVKFGLWSISGGLGFSVDRMMVDLGYRQLINPEGEAEDRDNRILGVALRGILF